MGVETWREAPPLASLTASAFQTFGIRMSATRHSMPQKLGINQLNEFLSAHQKNAMFCIRIRERLFASNALEHRIVIKNDGLESHRFIEDDKLPDDVLSRKYSEDRHTFVVWSAAWSRSMILPSKISLDAHYRSMPRSRAPASYLPVGSRSDFLR